MRHAVCQLLVGKPMLKHAVLRGRAKVPYAATASAVRQQLLAMEAAKAAGGGAQGLAAGAGGAAVGPAVGPAAAAASTASAGVTGRPLRGWSVAVLPAPGSSGPRLAELAARRAAAEKLVGVSALCGLDQHRHMSF